MKEENAIVLFDGVCNLCNASVRFIINHDRKKHFKFASLQSVAAQNLLRQFPHSKSRNLDSVVLIENNKIYTKSDAALRIFKKLSQPWKIIYYLIFLPRFVRDGAYDFISEKRYQWFGKMDNCKLPDAKYVDRFID